MKNVKDQGCPSALELFEYINSCLPEGQAAELKKHVEGCTRCSETISNLKKYMKQSDDTTRNVCCEYQVPERITALAKQLTTNTFDKISHIRPKERVLGQLWTTKPMEQVGQEVQVLAQRIVVILSSDYTGDSLSETIVVAPISLEFEFQSQYDLRVFKNESPLGYEFMIEVWNQTTTLVSQLKSHIGSLSKALKEDLRLLNQVYLGLGGELTSLADRIGLPIFGENDPRAIYQVQEIEECAYIREPALREISKAQETPVRTFEKLIDVYFRRDDGTLYKSALKIYQEALAAAPSEAQKAWFLYAKSKLAGEEIVAKFAYRLLQGELRIIFEVLPKILENNKLLITAFDKSGAKLFSEIVTAKKDRSLVVSSHGCVLPEDIEELSVTAVTED
jgi:hypothetical protein